MDTRRSSGDEYLIGIYYFAGWWRELPNKWHTDGRDWRPGYPDRVPLLGEYNDQPTMDREILAASRSGVNFFQILWYYQGAAKREPNQEKLNEGVRLFMASKGNRRMRFTLEFVNHPPFEITTDAEWERACREWCRVMKHASYLRVGGRPVFKVHGMDYFQRQSGGPERVAERIKTLRRIAREEELPNPLVSAGVGAGGVASGPAVAPYDFLTTYMEMPDLPQADKPYPYERLIAYAEEGWKRYAAQSEKPYVPYVPAGWDPRPWKDPRPSFELPDGDRWTDALRRVKRALDSSPKLGAPTARGTRKMLLIYAWNEFGEGGFVAPTRGEGDRKLRALHEVFSR